MSRSTADQLIPYFSPTVANVFSVTERRRFLRDGEDSQIDPSATDALPVVELPFASRCTKRALDILGASVGLLLLAPLLIVAAVAVKLSSRGPIFFAQTRVGRGGKTFRMFKFRTMVVNAEDLKQTLQASNEASGPVFKMKHDPRITRSGAFLRKFSIDELPQLLNVLKGDMSLVGPRPPVPKEVAQYRRWQMRRLAVVPGLTCIWQVSGRSRIGFDEWTRMDIRYIEQQSFFRDLLLIARTFRVVVTGDGAY